MGRYTQNHQHDDDDNSAETYDKTFQLAGRYIMGLFPYNEVMVRGLFITLSQKVFNPQGYNITAQHLSTLQELINYCTNHRLLPFENAVTDAFLKAQVYKKSHKKYLLIEILDILLNALNVFAISCPISKHYSLIYQKIYHDLIKDQNVFNTWFNSHPQSTTKYLVVRAFAQSIPSSVDGLKKYIFDDVTAAEHYEGGEFHTLLSGNQTPFAHPTPGIGNSFYNSSQGNNKNNNDENNNNNTISTKQHVPPTPTAYSSTSQMSLSTQNLYNSSHATTSSALSSTSSDNMDYFHNNNNNNNNDDINTERITEASITQLAQSEEYIKSLRFYHMENDTKHKNTLMPEDDLDRLHAYKQTKYDQSLFVGVEYDHLLEVLQQQKDALVPRKAQLEKQYAESNTMQQVMFAGTAIVTASLIVLQKQYQFFFDWSNATQQKPNPSTKITKYQ